MKKSLILLVLFVILASVCSSQAPQTPWATILGRVVGAGTYVRDFKMTASQGSLGCFQLKVHGEKIIPMNFQLGNSFLDWICPPAYISFPDLAVSAVGHQIYFSSGFEIGKLDFFISNDFAADPVVNNSQIVSFSFFDSEKYWQTYCSNFTVINMPEKYYGDADRNGEFDVADCKEMFDMVGLVYLSDTLKVITDLDGTGGPITSWKVYLALNKINNPNYQWPIFQNSNGGGGRGETPPPVGPIIMNWSKMSNGKWGLYSSTKITNGDLVLKNSSPSLSGNGGLFKQIGNTVHFVSLFGSSNKDPIIVSNVSIELNGTVNNGWPAVTSSTAVTPVTENGMVPTDFALNQNYPNPFNPTTTIRYQLSSAGVVILEIYDALGRKVETLVNQQESAGNHSVEFNAANLPSGVYIYRLSAGNFVQIKKMILSK